MGDIVIGSWAQSDCIGVLYNMVVVMPELVESQIESSSTYVGFSRTQECPCTVVLWMGALISAYVPWYRGTQSCVEERRVKRGQADWMARKGA